MVSSGISSKYPGFQGIDIFEFHEPEAFSFAGAVHLTPLGNVARWRDLACLAAAVFKKEKGRLRVLDALSGSGIRAARYLAHSQADFVWANDACDNLDPLIAHNLSLASPFKMVSYITRQ